MSQHAPNFRIVQRFAQHLLVIAAGGAHEPIHADEQEVDLLEGDPTEKIGKVIGADSDDRHPAKGAVGIIDAPADVEDALAGHSARDGRADKRLAGILDDMGLKVGAVGHVDRRPRRYEAEDSVPVRVHDRRLVGETRKAAGRQDGPDFRGDGAVVFVGFLH